MQSNKDDQVAITHFTSQAAAAQMLNGWRHEMLRQIGASEEFGPRELSLRLYSRYGMNDPTECLHDPRLAGVGNNSRRKDGSGHGRLVFPDTAFIYCGSKATEQEELNRLDLWRAYGVDGKGIAITTIWSRKGLADDGFDILRVKYKETAQLDELKNRYDKLQSEISKAIEENNKNKAEELHKKRMVLEVGYKNSD